MRLAVGTVLAVAFACQTFALDLVLDGKPVSVVVIPANASQLEREAALKLVSYLKAASGATLRIVTESRESSGGFVSIGKTKMAARAGITDRDLKYDGYHLRVKGGALYLMGRDSPLVIDRRRRAGAQGSIRAVLGLLEKLGFRWLQPTPKGTHVPKLTTVSVPTRTSAMVAAQILVDAAAGKYGAWQTEILECHLVVRGTTAACPGTRLGERR